MPKIGRSVIASRPLTEGEENVVVLLNHLQTKKIEWEENKNLLSTKKEISNVINNLNDNISNAKDEFSILTIGFKKLFISSLLIFLNTSNLATISSRKKLSLRKDVFSWSNFLKIQFFPVTDTEFIFCVYYYIQCLLYPLYVKLLYLPQKIHLVL